MNATIAVGDSVVAPPAGLDRFKVRLLIAVTVGYGLSYTCRLAIGVVKKQLIDGGVMTPSEIGTVGSALFFAYAFGKPFNGFLADHVDVRKLIAFGFLMSAVCNVGMAMTRSTSLAVLFWGFNGWFQAFGAPGCIITLARYFRDEERGRAYGIWSSSHSLGESMTFFAVGMIAATFGWRVGFLGAAGYGVVAAILVLALLPRGTQAMQKGASAPPPLELLRAQLSVLRIWPVWLLGLASAANYVTRYGINSWGILYLQEARALSLPTAGTVLMVSNLAGMLGSIGFGYISDLIFDGRRPPANLLFGLIEVTGLLIAFYVPGSTPCLWIGLTLFGVGLGAINASIGGLFAVDIVPKAIVGAVVGVMGTFSYLGSAIQEEVSGRLIQNGDRIVAGIHHYDFAPATAFWTGAAALSLLLGLLLWGIRPPVSEGACSGSSR